MRKSVRKPVAEINVVPYIDVMLVLLVIFMVTTPLLSQGVKVNLPQAPAKPLLDAKREPLIVSVNQKGQYFLNVVAEPNKPMAIRPLLTRVAAEIALARETHEQRPVFVKGDAEANYGQVVQLMAVLQKAGVGEVGLLTDNPKHV